MQSSSNERTAETDRPASWAVDCRAALADGERATLRVYARSAEPAYGIRSYHGRVLDRVRELERRGVVADHEFDVWGDRLRIGEDASAVERHAEALADLRIWARERGTTLPFQVRECRSTILDEEYVALVPPHVLVAVHCEGSLVGAAPCREGDRSTSVVDLLELLADRDRSEAHPTSSRH